MDSMTADELKAWRKRMKLTQEKAAEALGIGIRQYQHLEAGSGITRTIQLLTAAVERAAAT